MTLSDLEKKVERAESVLDERGAVIVHSFERKGRLLRVVLTDRLRRKCKKGKTWNTRAFLSTLENAKYGFDERRARSRGGADGIFVLNRSYSPKNEMMRKIFDRYLDRVESGAEKMARLIGTTVDELQAVRLVSHHMRLLGVMHRAEEVDWLVLVDYDGS